MLTAAPDTRSQPAAPRHTERVAAHQQIISCIIKFALTATQDGNRCTCSPKTLRKGKANAL